MFELQDPTLCMEWSHDYTCLQQALSRHRTIYHTRARTHTHTLAAVFVGGFSHDKHNEVLQLFLPEKLLPPHKQVKKTFHKLCEEALVIFLFQTLMARRDFKIGCGGISKWPIHHIKCVANTKEKLVCKILLSLADLEQ